MSRRKLQKYTFALLIGVLVFGSLAFKSEWGFFGHKRINRLAVFTLPPEMIGFFKHHIEFITQHAVDPDKRRYASKFEAIRHYIDLDHWGEAPFDNVPRTWVHTLAKYTDIYVVQTSGDTLHIEMGIDEEYSTESDVQSIPQSYIDFVYNNILPVYYEDTWVIDCDSLAQAYADVPSVPAFDCQSAFAIDRFSEYGIVPYHLVHTQKRLTKAFEQGDVDRILRLATEFGHYISDAHVPLHTTENYNGQFTNQVGIHAFWESRLPELFADAEYDFFVGQATYISNPTEYYWDVVLKSHSYVESLLQIERDLKETFPSDQQFCFEQRNNRTIRTQCEAFSRKYHDLLDGQVEARMTKAIQAIGSAWYTAWIDAGQPNLNALINTELSEIALKEQEMLEKKYREGNTLGRAHPQ